MITDAPAKKRGTAPVFRDPAGVAPGRLIVGTLGFSAKPRPWVILWLDDEDEIACVAPCTSKEGYPGVIKTGWPVQPCVCGIAMIQPYTVLRGLELGLHMPPAQLKRLRRALNKTLDLK